MDLLPSCVLLAWDKLVKHLLWKPEVLGSITLISPLKTSPGLWAEQAVTSLWAAASAGWGRQGCPATWRAERYHSPCHLLYHMTREAGQVAHPYCLCSLALCMMAAHWRVQENEYNDGELPTPSPWPGNVPGGRRGGGAATLASSSPASPSSPPPWSRRAEPAQNSLLLQKQQ